MEREEAPHARAMEAQAHAHAHYGAGSTAQPVPPSNRLRNVVIGVATAAVAMAVWWQISAADDNIIVRARLLQRGVPPDPLASAVRAACACVRG